MVNNKQIIRKQISIFSLEMQQPQKGVIFKKGKNSYSGNSSMVSKTSQYAQKYKHDIYQPKNNKKEYATEGRVVDEANWMGTQTPRNQNHMKIQPNLSDNFNNYPSMKKNSSKGQQIAQSLLFNSVSNKPSKQVSKNNQVQKSPTRLIQQVIKGITNNSISNNHNSNPYYSEQTEELLTQLLTNKNQMNSYIEQLQSQIFDLPENIAQNYQLLIILLRNISKSDVEVKLSSDKGLELNFNTKQIIKQENQIQTLQKKIKQKDDQTKQIVQDYEAVIRNFNDVIEKLLEERANKPPHLYH